MMHEYFEMVDGLEVDRTSELKPHMVSQEPRHRNPHQVVSKRSSSDTAITPDNLQPKSDGLQPNY